MRLVKQTTDWDCAFACIAMVCGVSLDDVMDVAGVTRPPLLNEEMRIIAHFQCLPTQVLDSALYTNRVHIVTVPSLNFEALNHAIVLTTSDEGEDAKVYDPQNGRKDKKFYTQDNLKCWSNVLWVQRCKEVKHDRD